MSLSVQFLSLLAMIGTGILAAALIDMIGTGISHAGKRSLLRKYGYLLEIFGWIFAGVGAFFILYVVRDGAWRIYDPFAQLSGLLLYVSLFYRPFRFIGRILLFLCIKPILFVLRGIYLLITSIIILFVKAISLPIRPFILIFRKLFLKYFKNK